MTDDVDSWVHVGTVGLGALDDDSSDAFINGGRSVGLKDTSYKVVLAKDKIKL